MKQFLLLQLLMFSAVTGFQAQTSLDDGLLLHYKLDGSAEDSGPNNFDGIPNVSYTDDYMGNSFNAALFNGSTNYIDFPNSSELKPDLPISIAFRVKFNNSNVQNSWVLSTNYSTDSYNGVFVNTGAGKIQFSYGDGDVGSSNESSRRTKTGTKPLNVGEWYYVVGVVRGATDMDIYVDCVNDGGTYSGVGGAMSYDNNPGSIGRGDVAGFSPYYLDGSLDDFRYWNRALSAQEVQDLCNLIASDGNINNSDESLRIYPNPFENKFRLSFSTSQNVEPIYASISDASGRIILEDEFLIASESSQIELDLSRFDAGLYFLAVKTAQGISIHKLIKN
ncbi:MAG: LamG-like jellyroll fold domain-containing protein [Bacteroidia bacterium]